MVMQVASPQTKGVFLISLNCMPNEFNQVGNDAVLLKLNSQNSADNRKKEATFV